MPQEGVKLGKEMILASDHGNIQIATNSAYRCCQLAICCSHILHNIKAWAFAEVVHCPISGPLSTPLGCPGRTAVQAPF